MDNLLIEPPDRPDTEIVADLVQKYLDRHQPTEYRLVVNRHAIVRGTGRSWLAEVNTDPRNKEVRADDFADRLVAANLEIDREFPRFVRLTSLVPQPGEVL